MEKLWSFIEESRIVLVALNDEIRTIGDLKAFTEILRNATDEKGRLAPGDLKHPRQHGRRCSFAVSTHNDDRILAANEIFLDRFRHRRVANPSIKDIFDFDISTRKRIPDDNQVGFGFLDVGGVVPLEYRNAKSIQEIRHRRIHIGIRTADRVSLLAKHSREGRHRRTTNAYEIDHLNNRGLQKLENRRRRGEVQTCAHTDWDDNIRARSVSSGAPDQNRECEIARQVREAFLQCVPLICVLRAVEHLAENDTADAFKLAGLLQVSDHPIDLIRLGISVLEKDYRVLSVDLVLCPKSRNDEGQASAGQAALTES